MAGEGLVTNGPDRVAVSVGVGADDIVAYKARGVTAPVGIGVNRIVADVACSVAVAVSIGVYGVGSHATYGDTVSGVVGVAGASGICIVKESGLSLRRSRQQQDKKDGFHKHLWSRFMLLV